MDLQASLSTWFPRQEYWSGLPFPSLGSLPDPGIKPTSPVSSPWQEGSLPLSHLGSPIPDYYGSTKLEYFGWMGSSENFLDVDQDCVSVEETVRECWWSRNSRHHVEGKVKKTKCHKWKAFWEGSKLYFCDQFNLVDLKQTARHLYSTDRFIWDPVRLFCLQMAWDLLLLISVSLRFLFINFYKWLFSYKQIPEKWNSTWLC